MSEPSGSSDSAAATGAASDELSQHQEAMRILLSRLHKQLVRRDVNDIFAKPVTDDIAPRYSEIITNPMDLSTMRAKIDANQYGNVADFRGDFRLMCQNAMTYNTPDTIFYAEADKLMTEGDRLMAFDKLSQLRKQCGLSHRLVDEDLQATGGRARRHPQHQQLLSKASPKSSPRSAGSGPNRNHRRPASAVTPPLSLTSGAAAASTSVASSAAALDAASSAGGASRPASASVPDDIFDSVVGGEASNSDASHCSGGAVGSLAESGGIGGDPDGEGSGNSSSNMVVLVEEEGSEAGQMEIEELLADEGEDSADDRPGAPASYTDPTPIGELTALAEAAAAEARSRLLSAGPPLIGRLEEPGLVFVPVDDYEDYDSSTGADVKRICRRQVVYPTDVSKLLGLQESEQAALDQLSTGLVPAAGGPLLAAQSNTDRVDSLLADQSSATAELFGEVYGDRLALEYVLSVQTYIAGCSAAQRRLVNKYFNLVTEGDHKRCEPFWRQFQRRQRAKRRQRRLHDEVDNVDEEEDDSDESDGEEGDAEEKKGESDDAKGETQAAAEASIKGEGITQPGTGTEVITKLETKVEPDSNAAVTDAVVSVVSDNTNVAASEME